MLIVKNDKLELSNEFVTCNGETKPIGEEGKDWWIETCNKHNYQVSFSQADYSQETLARFEKIKDFDVKHISCLEMYVVDGTISSQIKEMMNNIEVRKKAIKQEENTAILWVKVQRLGGDI